MHYLCCMVHGPLMHPIAFRNSQTAEASAEPPSAHVCETQSQSARASGQLASKTVGCAASMPEAIFCGIAQQPSANLLSCAAASPVIGPHSCRGVRQSEDALQLRTAQAAAVPSLLSQVWGIESVTAMQKALGKFGDQQMEGEPDGCVSGAEAPQASGSDNDAAEGQSSHLGKFLQSADCAKFVRQSTSTGAVHIPWQLHPFASWHLPGACILLTCHVV